MHGSRRKGPAVLCGDELRAEVFAKPIIRQARRSDTVRTRTEQEPGGLEGAQLFFSGCNEIRHARRSRAQRNDVTESQTSGAKPAKRSRTHEDSLAEQYPKNTHRQRPQDSPHEARESLGRKRSEAYDLKPDGVIHAESRRKHMPKCDENRSSERSRSNRKATCRAHDREADGAYTPEAADTPPKPPGRSLHRTRKNSRRIPDGSETYGRRSLR